MKIIDERQTILTLRFLTVKYKVWKESYKLYFGLQKWTEDQIMQISGNAYYTQVFPSYISLLQWLCANVSGSKTIYTPNKIQSDCTISKCSLQGYNLKITELADEFICVEDAVAAFIMPFPSVPSSHLSTVFKRHAKCFTWLTTSPIVPCCFFAYK